MGLPVPQPVLDHFDGIENMRAIGFALLFLFPPFSLLVLLLVR